MSPTRKHLHWTQRIALTQHNLHAAPRTGNYGFFSTLQAHYYLDGHDPVASLNDLLGDDADALFTVLDNLSSGIAWAYEDAFKTVYDNLRIVASSPSAGTDSNEHQWVFEARLLADIVQQRAIADASTDKMMSNAITLIQQQPQCARDDAAHVLCLGTSFVADALNVCLTQFEVLETCISVSSSTSERDEAWNRADNACAAVVFSVSSATCALKGILNMMQTHDDPVGEAASQARSRSQTLAGPPYGNRSRGVSTSTASSVSGASVQGWSVFRIMSTALAGSVPTSRRASVVSIAPQAPSNGSSFTTVDHRPRKSSVASIAPITVERTAVDLQSGNKPRTTPPLKSPPFQKKRPVSTTGGTVLSPIPPTPSFGVENLFNPFESSFGHTSFDTGNNNAFSANSDSRALTPLSPTQSQHISPGSKQPNPPSVPGDGLTRTASGKLVIGFPSSVLLDASATDMGPGSGPGPATASTPPVQTGYLQRRRRSTNITAQRPSLEALNPAIAVPVEEAVILDDDPLDHRNSLSLVEPFRVVQIGLGYAYVYQQRTPDPPPSPEIADRTIYDWAWRRKWQRLGRNFEGVWRSSELERGITAA